MAKQAPHVTVKTNYINGLGNKEPRNVTLWINPDKTVTLLGSIYHGNDVIVDQELVNSLQKIVDMNHKKRIKTKP